MRKKIEVNAGYEDMDGTITILSAPIAPIPEVEKDEPVQLELSPAKPSKGPKKKTGLSDAVIRRLWPEEFAHEREKDMEQQKITNTPDGGKTIVDKDPTGRLETIVNISAEFINAEASNDVDKVEAADPNKALAVAPTATRAPVLRDAAPVEVGPRPILAEELHDVFPPSPISVEAVLARVACAPVNADTATALFEGIRTFDRAGARNACLVAKMLAHVSKFILWQELKNPDGSYKYNSCEHAAHVLLGYSHEHTRRLIEVGEDYTAAQISELGVTKLIRIIGAPKEDRPALLARASSETGAELAKDAKKLRDAKRDKQTAEAIANGEEPPKKRGPKPKADKPVERELSDEERKAFQDAFDKGQAADAQRPTPKTPRAAATVGLKRRTGSPPLLVMGKRGHHPITVDQFLEVAERIRKHRGEHGVPEDIGELFAQLGEVEIEGINGVTLRAHLDVDAAYVHLDWIVVREDAEDTRDDRGDDEDEDEDDEDDEDTDDE